MYSAPVEVASGLFARRIGESVVFDRDDARQEAAIGMWQAGPDATSTVGYRRIIDALRRLIPGFRSRQQLPVFQADEVPEGVVEETPEDIASERELAARVQQMPMPARRIAEIILTGGTVSDAARDLGITYSIAQTQFRVACRWLRASVKAPELGPEVGPAATCAPAHHQQPITKGSFT